GKIANGIVTVHLGVCRGCSKTLIDAELFLSEEWAADQERRHEAGIPEGMAYRPKWQIALEQIDRAVQQKVALDWLTFDGEYGKARGFVAARAARQLGPVGEVPKTRSGLVAAGSRPRPAATAKARPAVEVVQHGPAFLKQRCVKVKLTQQTGGQQVWEVKAAQVWQGQDGQWGQRADWVIWGKKVGTREGEEFFFNSPGTGETEPVGGGAILPVE